jgi:hypothetical protein
MSKSMPDPLETPNSNPEPSLGQGEASDLKRWGQRSDTSGWKWDGDRQVWLSPDGQEVKAPPPPKKKAGGQKGNRGGGMKSRYKPGYARVARKAFEQGCTLLQVADMLGCSEPTMYAWRLKYPQFARAFVLGKDAAAERVERSLYERAIGYSFNAEKAVITRNGQEMLRWREHIPPDTAAALAYLRNMRPDRWRDRSSVDHNVSIYTSIEDPRELRALLQKQARALGLLGPMEGPVVDVRPVDPTEEAATPTSASAEVE